MEEYAEGFKLTYGENKNIEEAIKLFKISAEKGYLTSFATVGSLVPEIEEKKYWFEKGVEKGDPHSMRELGMIYFQAGEKEKAMELLKKGTEKDDPDSEANYGAILYNDGEIEKGFEHMLKAANKGSAFAQYNVAYYYREKADEWMKKAKENVPKKDLIFVSKISN